MSIAQVLAWEIQAQNEIPSTEKQRTALEIVYGVSLAQGDPASFSSTMASIIEQVTDKAMLSALTTYASRGLKK
jgi:hypothetical protein